MTKRGTLDTNFQDVISEVHAGEFPSLMLRKMEDLDAEDELVEVLTRGEMGTPGAMRICRNRSRGKVVAGPVKDVLCRDEAGV